MVSRNTSLMAAVTTPSRWGYEIVDIIFGEVRVRASQTVAMKGDLLREMETGRICEFVGRQRDGILLKDVTQ